MTDKDALFAAFASSAAEAGRQVGAEHVLIVAVGSADGGENTARAVLANGNMGLVLAALGAALSAYGLNFNATVMMLAAGAQTTGTVH